MPPTPLAGGARFSRKATSKVVWLPTIAAADKTPTTVELDAGTDLTPAIADISGFTTSSSYTDTPDLDSFYVGKVLESISSADSSITFYADRGTSDASTFFTEPQANGTVQSGYILFADKGLTTGKKADVWAVEVSSVSPEHGMGVQQIVVSYSTAEAPTKGVTLP